MALITGDQYKASIQDNRSVYLDGEAVSDILSCKPLEKYVNLAVGDYEMALNPKYHDLLTETLPDGEKLYFMFVSPRTREDLIRIPGFPIHFSHTEINNNLLAPRLGEHTDIILQEIGGFSKEELSRFRDEGVI